jgi:blue copper oxidase
MKKRKCPSTSSVSDSWTSNALSALTESGLRLSRRRLIGTAALAVLAAPALRKGASAQTMGGGMGGMMGMGPGLLKPATMNTGAFTRPLAIPPQLSGEERAGVLHYALRMGAGISELVAGTRTPTWGYNGALLGPALRVPRGRAVRIAVTNNLDQSTTTHWHGAHVPGSMDGGPQSLILPGQTFDYRFTLDQPGATLWYHPHPDTRTGAHTYAGLAGLLLIDDGLDARLGLPRTWGVDDIPVIVQDRRMAVDGRLLYMTSMMDLMGMKGDRFLVNGREQPYAAVPAQRVRLRLLNGSNARFYNFALSDGRAFHAIATDAGLLERPVEMRRLVLAPGERAEIVVDLSRDQGKTLVLRSDSGAVIPALNGAPMHSDGWDRNGFDLLQLRIVAPIAAKTVLPARMAEHVALRSDAPVRRHTLQGMRMMGGGGPGMMGMGGGVERGAPPDSGPGGMSLGIGGARLFSIDGQFMDMAVINQRVRLGSTEVWEVRNDAMMAHPFHCHGTSFRLLSRNGGAVPEWEQGWKDTVLVHINETVRMAARFTQPADDAHPFMYHCHILEHEGNGMMGQFTVA